MSEPGKDVQTQRRYGIYGVVYEQVCVRHEIVQSDGETRVAIKTCERSATRRESVSKTN